MIGNVQATQWAKEASVALMRNLDKNEEIVRLATITTALLADREERAAIYQGATGTSSFPTRDRIGCT
jgi:hypothetical protein